jgi:hypothetical protein
VGAKYMVNHGGHYTYEFLEASTCKSSNHHVNIHIVV